MGEPGRSGLDRRRRSHGFCGGQVIGRMGTERHLGPPPPPRGKNHLCQPGKPSLNGDGGKPRSSSPFLFFFSFGALGGRPITPRGLVGWTTPQAESRVSSEKGPCRPAARVTFRSKILEAKLRRQYCWKMGATGQDYRWAHGVPRLVTNRHRLRRSSDALMSLRQWAKSAIEARSDGFESGLFFRGFLKNKRLDSGAPEQGGAREGKPARAGRLFYYWIGEIQRPGRG